MLTKKTYEVVAEDIDRMIRTGVLKPGERLETIEKQAEFYHVGRSTIREALSLLRAKGLVESVQGGGTFVSKRLEVVLSQSRHLIGETSELVHVLQVRKIIEIGAVSLAVQNRTPEDIAVLEQIIRNMEASAGNEKLSQAYDVKFHVGIAKATHNPLVHQMMESVAASISRTIEDTRRLWLLYQQSSVLELVEEHRAIYRAIADQNEPQAVQLLTQHLQKVEDRLNHTEAAEL